MSAAIPAPTSQMAPNAPAQTQQVGSLALRTSAIAPSPTNPRKAFDETAIAELAESLKEHGVLQPVLVRPWPASHEPPKGMKPRYELVAGERRWRAAQMAGLEEIPALVRELTDVQVLEMQIVENVQRKDLHPLEEAEVYRQLLATKGKVSYDHAKIAAKIGRSVAYVRDRVKLLSLIQAAQDFFLQNRWGFTAGHAVILARLTPTEQLRAIGDEDAEYRDGGLFEDERTLFNPDDEDAPDTYKVRSVAELQAWVDEHVRFKTESQDIPDLFPETHQALKAAAEDAEKVVHITHEHFVQPEAKEDGKRTYGPQSWTRADEKPCEYSCTGVIVVGPGRGEAFKVCIDKKKCRTHWGDEIRAAEKRAKEAEAGGKTGEDRAAIERAKREEETRKEQLAQQRWKKAQPAISKALTSALAKAPNVWRGPVGDAVAQKCRGWRPEGGGGLARGTTADQFFRHVACMVLRYATTEWDARRDRELAKVAKALGVDFNAILEKEAPVAKPAAAAAPAKKKAPAARSKKAKR